MATKPAKTACFSYTRLSTDAQLLGDGPRRQVERSRDYASRHGLKLIEELNDHGVSAFHGANINDGALGCFLAAIRAGTVKPGDYLLVELLIVSAAKRPSNPSGFLPRLSAPELKSLPSPMNGSMAMCGPRRSCDVTCGYESAHMRNQRLKVCA